MQEIISGYKGLSNYLYAKGLKYRPTSLANKADKCPEFKALCHRTAGTDRLYFIPAEIDKFFFTHLTEE